MRFIAHRGNINGKCEKEENTIAQINKAIDLEYDVEVDIRVQGTKLFLGHDSIQEEIDYNYLYNRQSFLWVHAKDYPTFIKLYQSNLNLNIFSHDVDDVVITTHGFLWVHPRHSLFIPNSIALKFEYAEGFIKEHSYIYGICSDNPAEYRKEFID